MTGSISPARASLVLAVLVTGIGFLGLLSAGPTARGIEADLTQRAEMILSDMRGADWGGATGADAVQVHFSGRDATLSGSLPTVEAQNSIRQALTQMPGLRRVTDHTTVLPLVQPYRIMLRRTPAGMVWQGHVPSAAVRDDLARVTSGPAVAALELATGQPDDDWLGFVLQARTALAQLDEGQFTLSDRDLRMTGRAATVRAATAAEAALAILPVGYSARVDIKRPAPAPQPASAPDPKPDAAQFSLQLLKSADGRITATGLLPASLSPSGLPDGPVYVGRGEPGVWPRALGIALSAFERVQPGRMTLTAELLRLSGRVSDAAVERAIRAEVSQLPAGVTPQLDLRLQDGLPGAAAIFSRIKDAP